MVPGTRVVALKRANRVDYLKRGSPKIHQTESLSLTFSPSQSLIMISADHVRIAGICCNRMSALKYNEVRI